MVHVTIKLDEEVRDALLDAARTSGYESVEAYLESTLTRQVSPDIGAPPHLSFSSQDELEEMLVKRLEDPRPAIELTEANWKEFKQRIFGDRKGK